MPAVLRALTHSQVLAGAIATPVPPVEQTATSHSRTHVSATATPPAPATPSAGVPLASPEIPVTVRDPAMDKFYALVACPPLLAQPSQSSTYTWPDSLVDVVLTSAPPAAPNEAITAPEPVALRATTPTPLFFSLTPLAAIAPIPADSLANRALSSMAMGRTLADDLMDIEAGVPLPYTVNPVLRNPLLIDADEDDTLLFSHIRPLQGDALIRAVGVLPEELLPGPLVKGPVPATPIPKRSALTQLSMAPPTQEPSYIMEPPSDTYDDPSLSRSLAHLAGLFPSVSSETFTIILNKVNGDLSAASAWMQSVSDVTKAKGVLMRAFPAAPAKEVESSLRHYRGDFLLSFYGLARTFTHTEEWNDLKQARSRGV